MPTAIALARTPNAERQTPKNGEAPEVLLDEEERVWEGMESRREALFGALEELERLEGEGP